MEKGQSTVKLTKDGPKYLGMGAKIPTEIPEGLRLVHNFPLGHPDRGMGEGGFRAWWEKDDNKQQGHRYVCRCDWAPGVKHYDPGCRCGREPSHAREDCPDRRPH